MCRRLLLLQAKTTEAIKNNTRSRVVSTGCGNKQRCVMSTFIELKKHESDEKVLVAIEQVVAVWKEFLHQEWVTYIQTSDGDVIKVSDTIEDVKKLLLYKDVFQFQPARVIDENLL